VTSHIIYVGNISRMHLYVSIITRNLKCLASPILDIYDRSKIIKTGHVTLTTPYVESQVFDVFYLHIKCGDCRFSRSEDMIAGVKIEKWVT